MCGLRARASQGAAGAEPACSTADSRSSKTTRDDRGRQRVFEGGFELVEDDDDIVELD